ncbi:MAG: Gfo/Idh/MocA family oxidoreductase [Chloroflexi bacterium]|nr:Gfo/Idh/MocA family oxidoreductase [Chloroflexota bacterium]
MKPRVAILEASHWHVPLYLDALAEQADVVAIADKNSEIVMARANVLGATAYQDWHEAAARPDLDMAFVFGRHSEMPKIARVLIARGLPFCIEKPAGLYSAQVREIAKLADEAHVSVTVPFVQRLGPLAAMLRKIGRPDHATFRFIAGPPERYIRAGCSWMLDPLEAGGGCFINLGIHFVDLFLQAAAEPVIHVHASLHHRTHNTLVEDHAVVIMETMSGRSAIIETGYVFPDSPHKREVSYYAASPTGYLSIGDYGTAAFTDASGHSIVEQIDLDSDPLYSQFASRVLLGLKDGFIGLPTLADLAAAMEIVDRAYAQAR